MRTRWLIVLLAAAVTAVMCSKPTPVAPAEAGLTISANPTRIELGSTSEITVIARKGDGNPVNQGTEINFSTTLGTLSAVVAATNDRGVATVDLLGGNQVGDATVSASSGAATPVSVDVQVGSLAASIDLVANPRQVPKEGGEVNLVATVFDDRGNFLRNHPVHFETEVGNLGSGGSAQRTDSAGEARDVLTVTQFDLERLSDDFFLVFARTTTEGGVLLETDADVTVGGVPASITLSTGSTSVPAEGGSLDLIALVRDDGGSPSVGAGVNFLTDVGSLASGGRLIESDANGQAFDTLTVTQEELAAVATANSFNVTAQVAGRGGTVLEDSRSVGIQGDRPRALFGTSRAGTVVSFDNQTTGAATLVFLWEFGDGVTSDDVNPTHDYVVLGTYMARLTATNDFGEDVIEEEVVVDPIADFTFAPDAVDSKEIEFTDTSLTNAASLNYLWNFGDGSTSNEADPEHLYSITTTTTFTVRLTVSSTVSSDTVTKSVTVSP